ncbi:MAG TPA: hypothetical protein VEK11_08575 [Thermoanaerobaculia bacterium]|nr:hypothetical protein [Thermoanaerobaculia bacterium]
MDKQNTLFRPGSNPRLNAEIHKYRGLAGFLKYAQGYFHAANELVVALEADYYRMDPHLLVYPVSFLYRHGIELYLKHFAIALRPEEPFKLTHDLLDNWAMVSAALREHDAVPDDEKGVIDAIGDILAEFVEIDPKGEEFRYPESRKKDPNLAQTDVVSLEVLHEAMEIVERHFDRWAAAVR